MKRVPEYEVSTWLLVDQYNEQHPKFPLDILNLHPDLQESILVRCLNEALMNTAPIDHGDHRVYRVSVNL